MKRGHQNGQSGTEDQIPQLEKTSFAIGYAVSSTQHFLNEFSGSIQIPADTLASGVAKFLSPQGTERAFHTMPGVWRNPTATHQAVEPMALAVGASGHEQALNGNGRRHLSAATRARMSRTMKKTWARRKRAENAGRRTTKLTDKGHRQRGSWDSIIISAVGDQALTRVDIYSVVHKKAGGDKSVIYPAVSAAIKKGILIGDGNMYRVHPQAAGKTVATAA